MKRISLVAMLLAVGLVASAKGGKWTTLIDGKSMKGWNPIGNANWKVANGSVEATAGEGFLQTAASYKDFELKAEFWVDADANSGIFLRCQNRTEVTADNSYEVNVYDKRPDQKFATGAIVNVSPPKQPMMAGGKWNTFEVTAQGGHLVVKLNGVVTVDAMDSKHAEGPIAIQRTLGIVRFRKLAIRAL